MLLSSNLLKQPRKTSLDLVNKLLSLLLEQIFTPAINQRYKNTNIHVNNPFHMYLDNQNIWLGGAFIQFKVVWTTHFDTKLSINIKKMILAALTEETI